MKIVVGVKRVVDYNVRVQIKPDGSGVVTDGVKHSMNPFDEIAMEEAVRLKEKGKAKEIIAVTVGGPRSEETLRSALAFGADRAVHIKEEGDIQPLSVAKALAAVFRKENAQIFLCGKQSIDGDANQTGQMIAGLLELPQATFASSLEVNDGTVLVTREIDDGQETLEVDLPAVITADLRLNEPRYLKLPDIMKAKKKPIELESFASLAVTPGAGLTARMTAPPTQRSKGIVVKTADELVAALKAKALI